MYKHTSILILLNNVQRNYNSVLYPLALTHYMSSVMKALLGNIDLNTTTNYIKKMYIRVGILRDTRE